MKITRTKEQVEQDERKGKQKYSEIDIKSEMPPQPSLPYPLPKLSFKNLVL
jgi:hypothetical protein